MLKIGDRAPEFEALDERGNVIRLSDFKGKRLVLFFYPKDMTLYCTIEACNLRDNYLTLIEKGFQIIGVSADSQERHTKFKLKHSLPFPLLLDEDKKLINAYGVWGEKRMAGLKFQGIRRMTFVMDESGIIIAIFDKVKSADHAAQILERTN